MAKSILGQRVISHRRNQRNGHHWVTIHTPNTPGADLLCNFEESGLVLAFPPIPRAAGSHTVGYSLTFKSTESDPELTFEEVLTE